MSNEKQRKKLKKQRSQLSEQQQSQSSKKISNNLSSTSAYLAAKKIALYLPVKGEADPRYLFSENTDPSRTFYLPILSPAGDKHLHFAPWDKNTQFADNIYGIPEPIISDNFLPATQLDLVVMPLLGFDTQGNRLGMGGGYYDRTFAFELNKSERIKPLLIAYAYAFQECKTLTAQTWDVPFDAYVTEDKFQNI